MLSIGCLTLIILLLAQRSVPCWNTEVRSSLKNEKFRSIFSNDRDRLYSARASSDHCNALAFIIDGLMRVLLSLIPLPLERLDSFERWINCRRKVPGSKDAICRRKIFALLGNNGPSCC